MKTLMFLAAIGTLSCATRHVAIVKSADLAWQPPKKAGSPAKVDQYADSKTGLHLYRLKYAAGSSRAPHWHSYDRSVTVLSGRILMGQGEVVDEQKGVIIEAGGHAFLPANVPHWHRSLEDTVF